MLKGRFIDILSTFSEKELKRFRDYIRSPFFNKNGNVIRLYELIRKFHPDFDSHSCDKEKLFSKLYPGKKFNDTVIRILLADLGKLAEDFIGTVNIENNKYVQKRHTLKELQLRRIDNVFKKVLKEAEEVLSDKDLGKEYSYYYRHDLESIKNNFYLARNNQELVSDVISKKGENLICYTLIDLFIISESLLSNKNACNYSPKIDLVDEFLSKIDLESVVDFLKANLPAYYPFVGIFYFLYKTIHENEDRKNFEQAKKLFRDHFDEFNANEKILLLTKIQNVCKEKSRGGMDVFTKELFEIYKERIAKDLMILPRRKYLNIWEYRDILITSLELEESKWAEQFVSDFVSKLDPELQESSFNYGMAIVNFSSGNFEIAMSYINKVKYDYFLFKLDTKNLLAKIYYELGLYQNASEIIDTYRHFLSKNKAVSDAYRNYNLNFIRLYCEILKVKERDGKGLNELNISFRNQKMVRNRSWIAGKIGELNSIYH